MALEPTQACQTMASVSDASEASGSLACSGSGPRAKTCHERSSIRMLLSSPGSSLAPRSAPTTAETHEHAGQTASPSLGSASSSLSRSQSHATSTTSAATVPSAQSASSAPRHAPHAVPPTSTQRSIAEARAAVVADMGNMLDTKLQGRAGVLHANAAAIARQERDVGRALDGLRRDGDRLARLASETASRVKEVGNVQNFAEMMERDFLIVEDTLRRARARAARAAEDGSDDGSSWTGIDSASWHTSASREGSVLGDGGSAAREVVGDASTGTRGLVESLAGDGEGILASSANGRVKVVAEPVMVDNADEIRGILACQSADHHSVEPAPVDAMEADLAQTSGIGILAHLSRDKYLAVE